MVLAHHLQLRTPQSTVHTLFSVPLASRFCERKNLFVYAKMASALSLSLALSLSATPSLSPKVQSLSTFAIPLNAFNCVRLILLFKPAFCRSFFSFLLAVAPSHTYYCYFFFFRLLFSLARKIKISNENKHFSYLAHTMRWGRNGTVTNKRSAAQPASQQTSDTEI